jgi:hypothetical protein
MDCSLACIDVLKVHGTRIVQGLKKSTSTEVLELLGESIWGWTLS